MAEAPIVRKGRGFADAAARRGRQYGVIAPLDEDALINAKPSLRASSSSSSGASAEKRGSHADSAASPGATARSQPPSRRRLSTDSDDLAGDDHVGEPSPPHRSHKGGERKRSRSPSPGTTRSSRPRPAPDRSFAADSIKPGRRPRSRDRSRSRSASPPIRPRHPARVVESLVHDPALAGRIRPPGPGPAAHSENALDTRGGGKRDRGRRSASRSRSGGRGVSPAARDREKRGGRSRSRSTGRERERQQLLARGSGRGADSAPDRHSNGFRPPNAAADNGREREREREREYRDRDRQPQRNRGESISDHDHGAGGSSSFRGQPSVAAGYERDRDLPGKRLYIGRLPIPAIESELIAALSEAIRAKLASDRPDAPAATAALESSGSSSSNGGNGASGGDAIMTAESRPAAAIEATAAGVPSAPSTVGRDAVTPIMVDSGAASTADAADFTDETRAAVSAATAAASVTEPASSALLDSVPISAPSTSDASLLLTAPQILTGDNGDIAMPPAAPSPSEASEAVPTAATPASSPLEATSPSAHPASPAKDAAGKRGDSDSDDIVVSAELNAAKGFAFVVCSSIEAADAAVAMDGSVLLRGSLLKIGRPNSYESWARNTGRWYTRKESAPSSSSAATAAHGTAATADGASTSDTHASSAVAGGPSSSGADRESISGSNNNNAGGRRGSGRFSDRPYEMEARRNRDWDIYAAPGSSDAAGQQQKQQQQQDSNAAQTAPGATGASGSGADASSSSSSGGVGGGTLFVPTFLYSSVSGANSSSTTGGFGSGGGGGANSSSNSGGGGGDGSGIALSNTRKNTMFIQGNASASVVTAASLMALRERIAAAASGAPLPSSSTSETAAAAAAAAASASGDVVTSTTLTAGLSVSAAAVATTAGTITTATTGTARSRRWTSIEEPVPTPSATPSVSSSAAASAATDSGGDGADGGVTDAAALRSAPFFIGPGCPPPALTANAAPLLGMSGSQSAFPQPMGSGSVNIGSVPAATAALLGQGGLMTLLAGIEPTRILVVLNALTDADIRNPGELADLIADIGVEACAAVQPAALLQQALASGALPPTAPAGRLLAIRVPLPQRPNESVDPEMIRRGRLALSVGSSGSGGGGSGGGALALEDARGADRSSTVPKSAQEFFERVIKVDYGGSAAAMASVGLIKDIGGAAAATAALSRGAAAAAAATAVGAGTSTALRLSGAGSGSPAAPPADDVDPLLGRTRGLGKVFMEWSTVEAAVAAQRELSGRAFAGRVLATTFVSEEAYRAGEACDFAACKLT